MTLLAGFDSIDAAGDAVSAIIARRHRAGGGRDDGSADDSTPPKRPSIRISRRRRRAHRRARWARVGSRRALRDGRSASAGGAARRRSRSRSDQSSATRIWKGRKAAFAAMGRVSPNYYVQDGVVPRTKLPEVLRRIRDLEAALRPAHRQRVSCRRRQPASADLLRRGDSRPGRARRAGRRRNPALLHRCRRRRSPASTAWAPTRRRTCRRCSRADDLDTMQLVRCAFDPNGHLQSGQGVSDAAAVRRSARSVSRAPVERAGLARAILMAAVQPRSRAA